MQITLNRKAKHSLCGGIVKLRPGANDVDAAAWAKVKDQVVTKALIAEGAIAVQDAAPVLADEAIMQSESEAAAEQPSAPARGRRNG